MRRIVNCISINHEQEVVVKIRHTENFYKAANTLSEYLKSLPLTQLENDRLIALIIKQIETAEQDAFYQEFKMGIEVVKTAEK